MNPANASWAISIDVLSWFPIVPFAFFYPSEVLWNLAVVQLSSVAYIFSAQTKVVSELRCFVFGKQLLVISVLLWIETDSLLIGKMDGQRNNRWIPASYGMLLNASCEASMELT